MAQPKNIILLSDGTGNAANRVWKSNVWRIFESLDLREIAFYDDGVGTSSLRTDTAGRVWCSVGWGDPKEDGVRCYTPNTKSHLSKPVRPLT